MKSRAGYTRAAVPMDDKSLQSRWPSPSSEASTRAFLPVLAQREWIKWALWIPETPVTAAGVLWRSTADTRVSYSVSPSKRVLKNFIGYFLLSAACNLSCESGGSSALPPLGCLSACCCGCNAGRYDVPPQAELSLPLSLSMGPLKNSRAAYPPVPGG